VTVLLEDEPGVLSVSVLGAGSAAGGTSFYSSIFELDVAHCPRECYDATAKVKSFCFRDGGDGDKGSVKARLVLVDRNGRILKVECVWDASARVLEPRSVSPHGWKAGVPFLNPDHVVPGSLDCSRVGFLSPSRVLLGLNPFLLTLDIDNHHGTNKVNVWSKGVTQDEMESRAAWSRRLTRFVRASPVPGTMVDMSPVSALAVSEVSGSFTVVCTLHADGAIRVWAVKDADGGSPYSVVEAKPRDLAPSPPIQSPRPGEGPGTMKAWMISRLYSAGESFACALYYAPEIPAIPSSPNQGISADVDGPRRRLSILYGRVQDVAGSGTAAIRPGLVEELDLVAPQGAADLVSMDFDSKDRNKCSLMTWWLCRPDEGRGTGVDIITYPTQQGGPIAKSWTVCATYPASHTSIVSSLPTVVTSREAMLDFEAWKERRRVQMIYPQDSVYARATLDDAMYALDQQYMNVLFRPVSRAVNPLRPPSTRHIRKALMRVRAKFRIVQELGTQPVEVEVLDTLHWWREHDRRREALSLPRTESPAPRHWSTPSFRRSPAPAPRTPATPSNIEVLEGDVTAKEESEISRAIRAHSIRWRTLLRAIWKEEEALYAPLTVATCTGTTDDAAITVRNGAISVVVSKTASLPFPDTSNGSIGVLDQSARGVLTNALLDDGLSNQLVVMEGAILELVTSGDLAMNKEVSDPRLSKLDAFANLLRDSVQPQTLKNPALASLLSDFSDERLISELEALSCDTKYSVAFPNVVTGSSPRSQWLGHQCRLATLGAVSRSLESFHELLLGRTLLLSLLCPSRDTLIAASRRMYLHLVALRWALSRMVTMPKLPSITTCALDAFLLLESHDLQSIISDNPSTLPASRSSIVWNIAAKVIDTCFQCTLNSDDPEEDVPETKIISSNVSRHSKLRLVLMGPNIVFRRLNEDPVVTEERKMQIAFALIHRGEGEDEERANQLMARAVEMLSFESSSLKSSLRRVDRMSEFILGRNEPIITSTYVKYLQVFIATITKGNASASDLDEQWSMCFNLSMKVKNWSKAFQACQAMSTAEHQRTQLKTLALAMVADRAVVDLEKLCESHATMHDVAVQSLTEVNYRDARYKEALYVLHAAKSEWKEAAQALDYNYWVALDELRSFRSGDQMDDADERENMRLVIERLRSSALGSQFALSRLPEVNDDTRYLMAQTPTCSAAAALDEAARPPVSSVEEDERIVDRYFNLSDLAARSIVASGLSLAIQHPGFEPHLIDTVLLNGSAKPGMEECVEFSEAMISLGWYDHAIALCSQIESNDAAAGRTVGVLSQCLVTIVGEHLVPLSLGIDVDTRPSLEQLVCQLDALSALRPSIPPQLSTSRSKKVADRHNQSLKVYGMALLESLTTVYSSASMPLAVNVGRCFLNHNSAMPAWLESLLLWGAVSEPNGKFSPGIFARRPGPSHHDLGRYRYLGDPSALLHLYVESGRYLDACRVVTTLLDHQSRTRTDAHNRFPELGNMDFVPYNTIDYLWDALESTLRSGTVTDPHRVKALREAQSDMEAALEHHFSLLKRSEEGLLSARAISASEGMATETI
jgi:hypothetical protein